MCRCSNVSNNLLSKSLLPILALALFASSCSNNPAGDDPIPGGPAVLSVAPAHAAPGVTLTISGTTVDTSALASYRLIIGGQQTLLLTDTLGRVFGIAPAFFKDSTATWPSPSVAPLDIELFKDTVLVGRGVGIFTSDSLIQVPGSTLKLVNNTIATVESYKSILAALPTEPGIQEQLTFAMTAALDSLMYGQGDSSLTALLTDMQGNNPEALALLDAIYAADGSSARSQEIADAMAAIAASLNSGALRRGQVIPADVRLAAQMQLSSLLKLFGDSFIHDASSTASNIAFGTSWVTFAGFIPGAQVISVFSSVMSTMLSMVDLIFNKIMVASMPTVIDSFTITLAIDTISVGDTTVSSLKVYARNSPPQITLQDLLSQFQGIMGLFTLGASNTLLQQLEGTLNYLLGQLNNALQAYATANPDFSYAPIFFDIAGVPVIHWEAEITDPRLLKLNKQTPRIAVIDSLLEWRSTGDPGSASVTISPSFSEDATLIPIPSFLGFVGSSFGVLSDSSAVVSETQPVTIKQELVLFVDFAPTISQNGANVLGVKAGEIGVTGDTLYRGGLDVTLTVIGGGADPATGTTNTTGEFSSLITLDPFSDSVEVDVRVTRITGEFAAETVRATTSSAFFVKSYGGAITEVGSAVVLSGDGGYVAVGHTTSFGSGQQDFYLIKTDSVGDTVWTRVFGGADKDMGTSVANTNDGGYIMTGFSWSFGSGRPDMYVVKVDGNGSEVWSQVYGDSLDQSGSSIRQSADGGYLVIGNRRGPNSVKGLYVIKIDASGIVIWTKTTSNDRRQWRSVVPTTDGGYIMIQDEFNGGNWDVRVRKTDGSFNEIWNNFYGGSAVDEGSAVIQTEDGGYIVTGRTSTSFGSGAPGVFLIRIDPSGAEIWKQSYGGFGGRSVAQTLDGGFIVTGKTNGNSSNLLLMKTDASGLALWTRTFGGQFQDAGNFVALAGSGYVVTGGLNKGVLAGGLDLFLIRTDSLGNVSP